MKELIFRADDLQGSASRRAFVELIYQMDEVGTMRERGKCKGFEGGPLRVSQPDWLIEKPGTHAI